MERKKLKKLGILAVLFLTLFLSISFVSAVDYSKYYFFVTKETYTGAGGDVNGMDAVCNKDVPIFGNSRPTNGTYKAYISKNGQYPGASISGIDINRPIYRPDSIKIAGNIADLESGNWLNAIFSESYIGMIIVWTGITPIGQTQERDCSDWTSINEGGYTGLVGFGATSDKDTWTEFQSASCDGSGMQKPRVYCIGPFENAVVNYCGDGICNENENYSNCALDCAPFLLKDRYYMFVTNDSYDGNLGGIQGANEKCNSDINKPSSGYKAFISTNENYPSAASLGIDASLPIYSADTMKKIANNYADLIDGNIENPIYPSIIWTKVWTANYPLGGWIGDNFVIQDSACVNWTSNSSEKSAYSGYPYAVSGYYPPVSESLWWKYNYEGCSETNRLYCIGQYDENNYCGDNICNNEETYSNCQQDCSSTCGDGVCASGETCSSCSTDCGACAVTPPAGGGGSGSSGGGGGGGSSGGGGGTATRGGSATTSTNEYTVTGEQAEKGFSQELNVNEKINFGISVNDKIEIHSLTIDNIGIDFVELTIQSEPIKLKLSIGEEKKLNLTSSEYYDLYVKLEKIENSKATITIKTINEPIKTKISEITGAVIGFSKSREGMISISLAVIVLIVGAFIISRGKKMKKKDKII